MDDSFVSKVRAFVSFQISQITSIVRVRVVFLGIPYVRETLPIIVPSSMAGASSGVTDAVGPPIQPLGSIFVPCIGIPRGGAGLSTWFVCIGACVVVVPVSFGQSIRCAHPIL